MRRRRRILLKKKVSYYFFSLFLYISLPFSHSLSLSPILSLFLSLDLELLDEETFLSIFQDCHYRLQNRLDPLNSSLGLDMMIHFLSITKFRLRIFSSCVSLLDDLFSWREYDSDVPFLTSLIQFTCTLLELHEEEDQHSDSMEVFLVFSLLMSFQLFPFRFVKSVNPFMNLQLLS